MCEQTGTSGLSVRNEHSVRMKVSITELKGLRETEARDREYVGNILEYIRKCIENNRLIYFNSHMVYKIVVK
jgi:hypothetical protein